MTASVALVMRAVDEVGGELGIENGIDEAFFEFCKQTDGAD